MPFALETQAELNTAVAEATGESRSTIAARGFSLLNDFGGKILHFSDERAPLTVDWDALDATRVSTAPAKA